MVNTQKVKARIVEQGTTQQGIAKALNISQSALNLKINNKRRLNLEEGLRLADILCISKEKFNEYFFYN